MDDAMDDALVAALRAHAANPIPHFPHNPVPPDTVKLHSLEAVRVETTWKATERRALEPIVFGDTFKQVNCGSAQRTWNERLKIDPAPRLSAHLRIDPLPTAYQLHAEIDAPSEWSILGRLQLTLSSKTFDLNIDRVYDQGNEGTVNVVVSAQSKTAVRLQRTAAMYQLPFDIRVVVDGRAVMSARRAWRSGNDSYKSGWDSVLFNDSSRLSRYLGEGLRTFTCSGVLTFGEPGNLETLFREEPVDPNVDCNF